jgi:nitric oxide reductase activation protein
VDGGSGFAAITPTRQDGLAQLLATPELEDEDESDPFPTILKWLSGPLARQSRMSDWVQNLFGSGRRRRSGDETGDAAVPMTGTLREAPPGRIRAGAATLLHGELPSYEAPDGSASYPEWDCFRRGYRPQWCTVSEYDPPPGSQRTAIEAGDDALLRRRMARLGLGYQRHGRQASGDGLDFSALVDFAVDRKVGVPNDGRVYEHRLRTRRDLALVVVLDASGSTGERTGRGTMIWDEQRLATAALVRTLEEIGARVAAFGFNSQGRHVRFLRVKDFDDRFDKAAIGRLNALQPAGLTRLGAAVRHGIHLAAAAGTANRLLLVLSDGFPYEDGEYHGAYAEADCRRALDEATSFGVGCACLAISSATPDDALKRVWGDTPHGRISRAADLSRAAEMVMNQALQRSRQSPGRAGQPVLARRVKERGIQ